MTFKYVFFALLTSALLIACGDNLHQTAAPDDESGRYNTGVFIVNEGPFNGTGAITWHNPASGETVQDLFGLENGGAALGQFVQSLCLHEGKAYIVVNGANKVVVVDAATFKYEGEITGLALPRFFLPIDENTAYVSQWGADGLTGSLARVDLNTLQVTQTIPTGAGPEKMLRRGDLILVANSGGFGVDSTVSVVNMPLGVEQSREVVQNGRNPGALLSDVFDGGRTFALSRGYFLDPAPGGLLSTLFGINQLPNQSWATPAYPEDLCRSPQKHALYFTAGGDIYRETI
ncbi:MAG: YncE family protein, partial [Saprospiraceae bacterium]